MLQAQPMLRITFW